MDVFVLPVRGRRLRGSDRLRAGSILNRMDRLVHVPGYCEGDPRMSTLIDDPRVRLTRTVPSQYVHRAALAEVLLTDWQPAGEHRFLVRAQWPRAHSLYAPLAGQRH